MNQPLTTVQQRFQTAIELHEFGVAMVRHRLSRANPTASEEAVDQMLLEWLHAPRTASHGDGNGRPVEWPRRQ